VGVRIFFGPPTAPPSVISADVLRGLRSPDGSRPCRDGIGEALRWIGDREIPIEQALEEAKSVLTPGDLEWGLSALGVAGYGHGDVDGYGDGYGYGYGSGSGYGYGYGSGSGSGDGYGGGYDSGDGYGEEVE